MTKPLKEKQGMDERFEKEKYGWYYKDNASGFCFLREDAIKSFLRQELQYQRLAILQEIEKDLEWFGGKDSTAPKVIDKWVELKKKYQTLSSLQSEIKKLTNASPAIKGEISN